MVRRSWHTIGKLEKITALWYGNCIGKRARNGAGNHYLQPELSPMANLQKANRQTVLTTSEMFVYPMIVAVLTGVAFGFFHNSRIENAVSDAVDLGLELRATIEDYFKTNGEMPQSEADINLHSHVPSGILIDVDYQAGELGVPAADKLRTGTLRAIVDMTEFGTRFEDIKSGFLLIARAQEDDTIKWDCLADMVTVDALSRRYLPETCGGGKNAEHGRRDSGAE